MENINVVNDTRQAVVEPAPAKTENGGAVSGTPDMSTDTAVACRSQSRAENSGFRKLRLENESYRKELEKLRGKLSALDEAQELKRQNSIYLERLVSNKMAADLELIQKTDPGITDLSALGEDFIRLIENGIDATVAYSAVKKATDSKAVQRPPETGSVGTGDVSSKRFFTSRELDRLSAKDLENPAIFKKAMESLKRL